MDTYLDSYKETVGADLMGKRGIRYVINDSWEAGSQNWTDNMIAQFKKLRGYDPLPWMPVLAGQVVESAEASDRFLWDFRKTIARPDRRRALRPVGGRRCTSGAWATTANRTRAGAPLLPMAWK